MTVLAVASRAPGRHASALGRLFDASADAAPAAAPVEPAPSAGKLSLGSRLSAAREALFGPKLTPAPPSLRDSARAAQAEAETAYFLATFKKRLDVLIFLALGGFIGYNLGPMIPLLHTALAFPLSFVLTLLSLLIGNINPWGFTGRLGGFIGLGAIASLVAGLAGSFALVNAAWGPWAAAAVVVAEVLAVLLAEYGLGWALRRLAAWTESRKAN